MAGISSNVLRNTKFQNIKGQNNKSKNISVRNIKSQNIKFQPVSLNFVRVSDEYYNNAFEKEIEYLKSLDADRLLAGFREVKGLKPKAEVYHGWENTEIKGHTLGHYLSALSQAYAVTNDMDLYKRIEYIIGELAEAQLDNGYLFASGEYLFDNIENNKPAWVPWYTMHKIFEGIIMAYEVTGSKKAYDIMSRLADWVYNRSSSWDEETNLRVLRVEYGGMNDCLYDVYSHTNKKEHLLAAQKFDEIALFKALYEGKDILNGLHANTTIPKFVGALKRYMVLDGCDSFYLEASKNFWDIVVKHHTYITGGNSEWEHFGMPDILDAHRTNCNCETCNTYNMLKLSMGLFQTTGEKKYLDFYDNTLTNAILSSQNPQTGMTTYFQPMATGYFKVYSTPYDSFWCCTGTGMENFTKLNDGIYYTGANPEVLEITVGRYISSEFALPERTLKLKMNANYPYSEDSSIVISDIGENTYLHFILRLRIPDWCNGSYKVDIGGSCEGITEKDGFIYIDRNWKSNDKLNMKWNMAVTYERLQDNPYAVAFKYGPVVLCAGLGTENMETSKTGVDVTIPACNIDLKDYIFIKNMTVEQWLSDITNNMVRKQGTLEFTLRNTDEDERLVFKPYYKQHDERYGIYFSLFDISSENYHSYMEKKERKRLLELMTVDLLPVSNDQYELQHEIKGKDTFADTRNGYKCRGIYPGGFFSYRMKVDSTKNNELILMLAREGKPVEYEIYADDELLVSKSTMGGWPPRIYEENVAIPINITNNKSCITIKFINKSEAAVFKLYGHVRMIAPR